MNESNNSSNISSDLFCPSIIITLYVIPIISGLGIVFNALSVFVFSKMLLIKPRINPLFKILYIKSILELCLFLFNVFMPMYYCQECNISQSWISQIWYIYIFNYAEDVVITCSIVFEILASLQCYLNLMGKSKLFCWNMSKISSHLRLVFFVVLVACMAYSSFIIFRFEVVLVQDHDIDYFKAIITEYYKSQFDSYFRFVQNCIRDILPIIVLFLIHTVLLISIQERVQIKRNFSSLQRLQQSIQTSSNTSIDVYKRNTILTVIFSGLIYVVGHIPLVIYYLPFNKLDQEFWSCYYEFSFIPFYMSYLPNFFIYCFFNKLFSKYLLEILGMN